MRFAFALHLHSTIERVEEDHMIVHPNLNSVRKNLKLEFQVAMDLSSIIEEELNIEIPFDEIGFISMFLSLDAQQEELHAVEKVGIIVLMHGKATATNMLETAQELLGSTTGTAMNMTLDIEVKTMYNRLLNHIQMNPKEYENGILFLTDMGSLNSFAHLIYEETGIRTKTISMTGTMIVLEALRMADVGRSLEDIFQNIQISFETAVRDQFKDFQAESKLKKAVVVT